jgi:ABC-2 type transport system permease protein
MLRGLWKLTWVETKIFVREPMGLVGTLAVPLILFVVLGRIVGVSRAGAPVLEHTPFNVPVLSALLIAVSAVMSLVTIMSIYREGGILKRLRATPLSPLTILSAHVAVKLVFAIVSLVLLVAAGRQIFPGAMNLPLVSFSAALILSTLSILSLGFVIASIVPTARFAQPIGAAVVYPMIALSGVFFPIARLPRSLRVVAQVLPTTHAVALMQGVWERAGWRWSSAIALMIVFVVCSAVSARMFRWE